MGVHESQIKSYTGFNVHDTLKGLSVPELKEVSDKDRLDIGVLCLNLEKDLNISNIVRSSHCLGVKDVFILGDTRFDSRGCVGSQHYTNVIKIRMSIEDICSYMKNTIISDMGYDISCIDMTKTSKSISSYSFWRESKKKICLVMGNENSGIPECILKSYQSYHIPQRGVIRSMNVSSAASIVIHKVMENKGKKTPWF